MAGAFENLLVTCGGKWVGMVLQLRKAMGDVACLRGGRIFVSSSDEFTPAGHFADAAFQVPAIADPGYVAAMLELCESRRIRVVVPLIDLDVERLAPHRAEFEKRGTTVVAASADATALCLDKLSFERFLVDEGIPCPRTIPREELESARYPIFSKKRRGFGSLGAGRCGSFAEAQGVLERDPDAIFQPCIEAREYSVDAYLAHDGRCTVRVQRARDKVVAGEAFRSHTLHSSAIGEIASRVLDGLVRRGLRGPVNVQIFEGDPPLVIEANARVGSGFVLSNVATRGRLLRSILEEACGGDASGDPDDYARDVWLHRFFGDVFLPGDGPAFASPGRA